LALAFIENGSQNQIMENTIRLPGSFSLSLLYLFAGCEPPAPAPSLEDAETSNPIDTTH
jgi:hypothetical protein